MQGGSFAASPINVSRLTFRRMTTLPAPSKPTTLQTFLPRSTPRTEIVAITLPPSDLRRAYDAGRKGGPFHKDRARRGAAAPGRFGQRWNWFASQLDLDPAKLVFADETGASTSLARKHGRCRRGRRLRAAVPHGHYKTVTLVAGLRLRGLAAPRVYDRPMNA